MNDILKDFRVGWRWLAKEPGWSALVIAGLAVGFACCFLLLGYTRFSMQYNRYLQDADNTYQLEARFNLPGMDQKWTNYAPFPAAQALKDSGLIERASIAWDVPMPVRVGTAVSMQNLLLVDPDFAQLFELKTLSGDLQAALTRPDRLALTDDKARQLFGSAAAVGKSIKINGQAYLVSAVVAGPPLAGTQPFTMLASRHSAVMDAKTTQEVLENWGGVAGKVYFRPRAGISREATLAKLQQAFEQSAFSRGLPPEFRQMLKNRPLVTYGAASLAEVYFDPKLDEGMGSSSDEHVSRSQIAGLAAIGLLILLLAAINYINLSTVRTIRRQREIGVRKVLGASIGRVAGQFLLESVLVSLLAMVLGLILAWLALPGFSYLMSRELSEIFNLASLAQALLAALLVGALAGAYPAWVAARVRATQALAGRDQQETPRGIWLRRSLTVLQFSAAMALSGVTLAIAWQAWYGSSRDPGFQAQGLLTMDAGNGAGAREAFRTAVAALPGVGGAAYSRNNVADGTMNLSNIKRGQGSINVEIRAIGCAYLETYGVKVLAGRTFPGCGAGFDSAKRETVISESAARDLGYASPWQAVGRQMAISGGQAYTVVGVVSDIHLQSAREQARSWVYLAIRHDATVLSLRFQGDEAAVRAGIARLWPRYFPDYPLKMDSARYRLDQRYAVDAKQAGLLAAAAGVALLIAAFGIYVLAAYSVQRMSREVVLRKLHGASGAAIAGLVSREFLWVLAASALIGLAPAALYIRSYLSAFVERAPIGGWTLLLALGLCVLAAALAVWRHLLTALRLRPVLALRG
ncbi:ABC transporter permease [Chromobacterium sp. IIBBL 290-4]|uniref:ABC transporter permease n=1 Tax=Chromobacterium sp. IIBBL 290-4 TaxID=2953890 RepID=UPI0020B70B00|nr:ABC transporter permease [Chromobacterium sp. IIBBL 290-4]UTH75035.1 ABC transporter permease [Chromobacterium sp. IIBBL 290-4]